MKGHNYKMITMLMKKANLIEVTSAQESAAMESETLEVAKKMGAEVKKERDMFRSASRPTGVKCMDCNKMGRMAANCWSKMGTA